MIRDKKFFVSSDVATLKTFTIENGLQQGTVNAPTLFSIYTIDLPTLFGLADDPKMAATCFADDLVSACSFRSSLKKAYKLR